MFVKTLHIITLSLYFWGEKICSFLFIFYFDNPLSEPVKYFLEGNIDGRMELRVQVNFQMPV